MVETPRAAYKEFQILPTPQQLADSGEWTLSIVIEKHTGDAVVFRNFSTANSFPTKDEALQRCLEFGRKIIDGEVENLTIADL